MQHEGAPQPWPAWLGAVGRAAPTEKTEICCFSRCPWQCGQSGSFPPSIRASNGFLQSSHKYSNIGIMSLNRPRALRLIIKGALRAHRTHLQVGLGPPHRLRCSRRNHSFRVGGCGARTCRPSPRLSCLAVLSFRRPRKGFSPLSQLFECCAIAIGSRTGVLRSR